MTSNLFKEVALVSLTGRSNPTQVRPHTHIDRILLSRGEKGRPLFLIDGEPFQDLVSRVRTFLLGAPRYGPNPVILVDSQLPVSQNTLESLLNAVEKVRKTESLDLPTMTLLVPGLVLSEGFCYRAACLAVAIRDYNPDSH